MTSNTRRNLVGTREGAKHFGITQQTLRKWIQAGTIPGYRVGSRILIDLDESEQKVLTQSISGDA